MFSHMAMMWANALLKRGLVLEGWKVIDKLYLHCQNFAESNMYPGIPEYIDPRGKGMYPYLTGSASWLLLTMLSELFGVQGKMGDLVFEPKIPQDLFDAEGKASVSTQFANRRLIITYVNPQRLEYGDYFILTIKIDGDGIPSVQNRSSAILSREQISSLSQEDDHEIIVELGAFLP